MDFYDFDVLADAAVLVDKERRYENTRSSLIHFSSAAPGFDSGVGRA